MKYILLTLTLFPLLSFAQVSKNQLKQQQINKCISEFNEIVQKSNVEHEEIKKFCECNTNKIFEKFTVEEIQKMDQIMATGTASEKQKAAERIAPIIVPCFADLQSKLKK